MTLPTAPAGSTYITEDRLRELERKEKGHDAYVWASKRIMDKRRSVRNDPYTRPDYLGGYTQALYDFSVLVLEAPSKD